MLNNNLNNPSKYVYQREHNIVELNTNTSTPGTIWQQVGNIQYTTINTVGFDCALSNVKLETVPLDILCLIGLHYPETIKKTTPKQQTYEFVRNVLETDPPLYAYVIRSN